MVTGDNERTAQHVARLAGIDADKVVADVRPAGKLAAVEAVRSRGLPCAFVGDGINDAPALAVASVGVAVASGTDVAMEAADVVLMKPALHDVVVALDLSQAVMRRIRINFVWAFLYNVVGIPLAAGVLYPGLHFQLPPMFAGGAMALSSVSVVLSSLTLRLYRPPRPLPARAAARDAAARAADAAAADAAAASNCTTTTAAAKRGAAAAKSTVMAAAANSTTTAAAITTDADADAADAAYSTPTAATVDATDASNSTAAAASARDRRTYPTRSASIGAPHGILGARRDAQHEDSAAQQAGRDSRGSAVRLV